MSILIAEDTTFIVQGITGREAVNLTRECLDYGKGARIVGGVTPGRLGREVHGVPVFDTVAQAVAHHGGPIDGSVVTVPPAFTRDAVLDRLEHRILRERGRHGHHRAVDRPAVVGDRLGDRVEHGHAVDLATEPPRRDAADDLRARTVVEALAREVDRLASGYPLDDERGLGVDQDAHAGAPGIFSTARRAASLSETERSA